MDPYYLPVPTPALGKQPRGNWARVAGAFKTALPYVPTFTCIVGIIQTVLFLLDDPWLFQLLVYSPDHRHQTWRYLSYTLLHLDSTHLLLNLCLQTVLAVPLEAEQGAPRTALVYVLGGIAGSLGTAVLEPELSMAGASACVYAMLLAHIPNILYNCELLKYKWYRVVSVVCLCIGDVSYNVFSHSGPVICLAAHALGAIAGLLLGFTVFSSCSYYSSLSLSLLRYTAVILLTILFIFSIMYIQTYKNKAILH